jgi:hypothetical protein
MLLLAAGIGEAEVYELDFLVFDQFQNVLGRHVANLLERLI